MIQGTPTAMKVGDFQKKKSLPNNLKETVSHELVSCIYEERLISRINQIIGKASTVNLSVFCIYIISHL